MGGSAAYGYAVDNDTKTLSLVPEHAEVVRSIYEAYVTDGKGMHRIARELTDSGVPPPLTCPQALYQGLC